METGILRIAVFIIGYQLTINVKHYGKNIQDKELNCTEKTILGGKGKSIKHLLISGKRCDGPVVERLPYNR